MTMSRERTSNNMPAYHEWTTEDEIQLFCALDGLKPIGINKHFYMACITERLSRSLNRDIPPEAIWAQLRTLYNLDLLDDKEPLPFPNEEREFFLPEQEFSALLTKKVSGCEEKPNAEVATRPSNSNSVPSTNDYSSKETPPKPSTPLAAKDLDKKVAAKLAESGSKRGPKRTRGSVSHESPSTTPPPVQNSKRRRI